MRQLPSGARHATLQKPSSVIPESGITWDNGDVARCPAILEEGRDAVTETDSQEAETDMEAGLSVRRIERLAGIPKSTVPKAKTGQ